MLIIDSITNLVKDVSRLFKNDFSKNITKKKLYSHINLKIFSAYFIFSILYLKRKKIIVCITGKYCAIYFF